MLSLTEPIEIATGPLQVHTWLVPLTGNKVFAVDPAACAFSHDGAALLDYLAQHALELVGILLTHGHFDHVMGTRILKDAFPDCKIAVHALDKGMAGSRAAQMQGVTLHEIGMGELTFALENLPDADALLSGGETLDRVFLSEDADEALVNALKAWQIIHTPGHTQGSLCAYNAAENILLSGDTLFYRTRGRTDLPGGSEQEIQQSLRLLYQTIPPKTRIYPGHGKYGFPLEENF